MRSIIKSLGLQCTVLAAGIIMTGCTLSEPKQSEENANDLLLTSVSTYGLTIMKFDYDNQNRIKEINVSDGVKYTFKYNGNNRTPSEIESWEYEYYYLDGKEEKKIEYHSLWTNIQSDSNGYIVRLDAEDTDYSYNEEMDQNTGDLYVKETTTTDIGVNTFIYNSKGQLTESVYWDKGDEKNADHTYINWENDLITWSGDGPGVDHRQYITFDYSNVKNVTGQWDPNNEIFGPIAVSGFFGPAPSKYIKAANMFYSNHLEEVITYSYNVGSNGLIKSARVMEDETDLIVFNFNYSKKR